MVDHASHKMTLFNLTRHSSALAWDSLQQKFQFRRGPKQK